MVELPAGGGAQVTVATGFSAPSALAVDNVGDIFVSDTGTNEVYEIPAGSSTPTVISSGVTLTAAGGVALDAAGDVFVADAGPDDRVVEFPAGGGAAKVLPATGLAYPTSVTVDAAGDVFIADASSNDRVVELPAGGGSQVTVASGMVNGVPSNFTLPSALALDGKGDLLIADDEGGKVVEVQRSQPPSLSFPTATTVGTTDTTDGTETAQVFNIGNEPLVFTGLTYPADFSNPGGDANTCTSSTSLTAGLECDVPVEFTPEDIGSPLSEDVTLTDNNLNVTGATQNIGVSGTGSGTKLTLSPSSLPNATAGTNYSVQLSATGGLSPYSFNATGLPGG